jgi:hypothetical protein
MGGCWWWDDVKLVSSTVYRSKKRDMWYVRLKLLQHQRKNIKKLQG